MELSPAFLHEHLDRLVVFILSSPVQWRPTVLDKRRKCNIVNENGKMSCLKVKTLSGICASALAVRSIVIISTWPFLAAKLMGVNPFCRDRIGRGKSLMQARTVFGVNTQALVSISILTHSV